MFTTNEISFKVSTNVEFKEEIERLEIIIELLQTIIAKAKLKDLNSYEDTKPKLLKIEEAEKCFDAILENAESPRPEMKDELMSNSNMITCECGTIMTKKNLTRHIKSAKHQNFIKLS